MYDTYEFHSTADRGESLPMANLTDKVARNTPGRYYVDDTCIDCDLCRATAPTFFTRDDESSFSYVYRQPETPDEQAAVEECVDMCPAGSIGSDGE